MSVRLTSLGSGSKGNATLIQYLGRSIVIDSGFSCKALEERLGERGVHPESIDAILVTHEHSDHFKGVSAFSNKYNCQCWLSRGTSLHHLADKLKSPNIFCSHSCFHIGEFEVTPVAVPHDAREACQFVVNVSGFKLGILTDLGHITPHVEREYNNLDALLLEFNHDSEMLLNGRYPQKLKQRVGGSLGHLSNTQSLAFLKSINTSNLQLLAAMHLSEENNSRMLVENLLKKVNLHNAKVVIADQDAGFDWFEIK